MRESTTAAHEQLFDLVRVDSDRRGRIGEHRSTAQVGHHRQLVVQPAANQRPDTRGRTLQPGALFGDVGHHPARRVAHVSQGRGSFGDFTVEDNLALGAYTVASRCQIASGIARWLGVLPRQRELRRAADVSDRPRSDVQAAPADVRRPPRSDSRPLLLKKSRQR